MTFREKLADWISGGAVSASYAEAIEWRSTYLRNHNAAAHASYSYLIRLSDAQAALNQIAAMETPSANATVRRMAERAREALQAKEQIT